MLKLVKPSVIIAFVFVASSLLAQGTIRGVITDSLENVPLVGANVMLEGTALGAATDIDGSFLINRVPEGTYSLKVTYIGYFSKTITVTVIPEKTLQVEVKLDQDIIQGETIVVTAQAMGQAAAINRQLASTTITNVVSSEKILELPDANAAESVGRLPGISILRSGGEGNKVVIRGLSPTYNSITIGGDRIPATDMNDRSVDLSMISPEILEGIEVTKALTPDKDADALGGSVDFQLATAPYGGFNFNLRYTRSYNYQRDDFGNYKVGFILSNRLMEDKFGLLFTGNLERTNRGSDQFNASYDLPREKREDEEFAPITTVNVRFEHSLDIRNRYGFNIMMDYLLPGGKILLNNFFSRLDRDAVIRQKRFDMGGSNKLRYFIEDRQTQIDIMLSSLGGEHNFSFMLLDWRLSRSASATRYPLNATYEFEEAGAFNTANIPQFASPEDIINNAYNDIEATYFRKGEFEPERSDERDLSAQINLEIPYSFTTNIAGRIKGGVKYRNKLRERDRDFMVRRLDITDPNLELFHTKYGQPGFTYERMSGTNYPKMINYLDRDFDAGNFLDGKYEFGLGLDPVELKYLLDNYLMDNVYRFSLERDLDDYSVTENLGAGYIMTEINIGNFLMFMPGVRYEHSNIDTKGKTGLVNSEDEEGNLDFETVRDTSAFIEYGNWFPMVHLRIKPTEWFDIRLAYTESVSYPRLGYIIPAKRIKAATKRVEYGNPYLKPQMSANYDIYLSLYSNRIGLFTLGGFYKKIDDLIYLRSGHIILDPAKEGVENILKGYSIERPENNINVTEVYGYEVEWQTNFGWLPSPFNGLVLNINYTHLFSETQFPRSFVKQETIPVFPFRLTTVIDTFRTGPMPDLASDIANIMLGYDIGRFSGRVSMLLQGKTLNFVGVRDELDGFTNTYIRWDMSLKYDITDEIEVFCNWYNFSNRPDEAFMQTVNYPTAREFYGSIVDLGFVIKF